MNNFEEKIGEVRLPEIGTEGCLQMFQIAWEIDHSAPTPRDPADNTLRKMLIERGFSEEKVGDILETYPGVMETRPAWAVARLKEWYRQQGASEEDLLKCVHLAALRVFGSELL